MNLHPADAIVLIVYLIGITVLGSWMGRKVSRAADYFMPRRFGKLMMIMHAFGTGTASDQSVTVASATAKSGLSGIWYQWMWLFPTPFYWLIAPIMRRFRATTTADVYELRYNRSVAMLFAVVGIAGMAVKIGVMLKGAGALIHSGTGGSIDANVAIPIITALFVAYGIAGGLGGAIMTDFVQGGMTIIFSIMLLPVVLMEVGGLNGMRETIATESPGSEMLSIVAPGEIGPFYIIMLSVNTLFLIVAMPSAMGNCAAGKTELDSRVGFMFGTFIKRICTVAWCLTTMAAVAWYLQNDIAISSVPGGDSSIHPDEVYGDMAHRFLPGLLPGMLGIFLACLLAGVMSSCDSFMIASSALFTENIYRVVSQDKPEKHYILVGRVVSLLVVIAGVVVAYALPGVISGLKIWYKIAPMMGIAFWMGLLWRGATPAGAWASVLSGFAAWWLVNCGFFVDWAQSLLIADPLRLVVEKKGAIAIYEPWQMISYLGTGLITGIIVSMFTQSIEEDRLDRYYALTRTPIEPDEQLAKPCTLPASVPPVSRPMLLKCCGLEIPQPSGTAIVGFILGWLCVVVLIGGFVSLVQP